MDREDGFSIVELMITVLIIAVLLAIAVPTYLRSQRSAAERAAQSDLRTAISAAKLVAAESSPDLFQIDGVDVTPADLKATEPALEFDELANANTRRVGVVVSDGGSVITLLKQSTAGEWYGIAADASGTITFCSGEALADCDDATSDPYATGSW